jgi:hypothetical protein
VNENSAPQEVSALSAPLAENEHVRELFSILQDNNRDTAGLEAPYKAEKACFIGVRKLTDRAITALGRLEQGAEAKRSERAATPKKPTLMERLEAKKQEIRERELEKPPAERAPKSQGLEV